jgi:PAS domain S-box-containing protein
VMELSRYLLEVLRKDEEFILHRGRSPDGGSQLLVLSPVADYPKAESLKRLEHEYSLREELDPVWVARPMAIARHWDRTVLGLEDPGGVPLDQLLGHTFETSSSTKEFGELSRAATEDNSGTANPHRQQLDIAFALRLAISLSSAIDRLHQRSIIHKDIKPANVLVDPVSGQCWLMGFGIASRLPRERRAPEPPEFVAGTLAYMAPEQTGHMNRSIDSRSDLYSLGVTLYEVLTGTLPFTASDPMEWVHCHIARMPISPAERLKTVPTSVSAVIMKLLAKTAEERYQTAAGVKRDLQRCLTEWEAKRYIDEFPLGKNDTPDRLLIPEKLYGRAREIDTLLASFARVMASGTPELVLVSGYSGIGKSSVVSELHKELVPPRGLFASGKFDQYKRDIPYATLARAFQSLIRQLLAKSEVELHYWRHTLQEALGANGLLITSLVPELKLIVGEQPAVPEVPPQEAQNRFRLVFRRFVGAFARPEHPLALFLDDLQWLDAATLELLEHLMTEQEVRHLLLVGAYRDNEVSPSHPLVRTLDAIRKTGVKVQEIVLAPLVVDDIGRLVADSLHCPTNSARPLAELIHEKTGGNPFFAIQFFTALADEDLLVFDKGSATWSWDLARIRAKRYTDNVVDLMLGKLNRLPQRTQEALGQLACLGNMAELATLSMIQEESEEEIHASLWEAVRTGLVLRPDSVYSFPHDRVQEAAYALIPESERVAAHLRIGRLFALRTAPEELDGKIFEIVNQFDRGTQLIDSPEERQQVAEFNLMAGKQAKSSTAYASALAYLKVAEQLLPQDCWHQKYELALAISFHEAECEFLTGDFSSAEQRLSMLSQRALNIVDLAAVTRLMSDLFTTTDRLDRAVQACLEYLRRFDIALSAHPTEEEVAEEEARIRQRVGSEPIETLVDLPTMSDPTCCAIMDVLMALLPAARFTDGNLHALTLLSMVNLSLQHGNCDASCLAYAELGHGPEGASFAEIGFALVEQRGFVRFKTKVYTVFAYHILPWTRHLSAGFELMRRSFVSATETGDHTFAAFCTVHLVALRLALGDPLADLQHDAELDLARMRRMKFGLIVDCLAGLLIPIYALRGVTPNFPSSEDAVSDEASYEQHFSQEPGLAIAACWYWIRKLQARFYLGDYESALESAARAEPLFWTGRAFREFAEYHFYAALTRAAIYDSAPAADREGHLSPLAVHHRQLAAWAESCPENFKHRASLVSAEIARIEGRQFEAIRLYEEAIQAARENGFIPDEGIASELAARFHTTHGLETIAHAYLQNARYCYLRWGALRKVRQIDQAYPLLHEERTSPSTSTTIGAPVEQLDVGSVVKASQAVSSEIVLEKLIGTLMRTAIEHAGAGRGLLILPRSGQQRIEAEATTSGNAVIVRLEGAAIAGAAVPESIIHYVVRTQESVILDDASAQNPFSEDPYLRRQHARSILCLPLINQSKLIGLLYLENNLTPRVFTPTRIDVLKLLASQAAISLENTRLYRDLEEREAKIRRLVDANIVGIFTFVVEGRIIEANDAFLNIVGYDREDLVSGRLSWMDLTPPEWRDRDARKWLPEYRRTGILAPFEKEYFRKDGSRVPVMIGVAAFEGSGNEGVAFVLDLSEQKRAENERKRAEEAVQKAQTELTHLTRVAALGELTASIAHEMNQPLAAVVANANAGLRWLSRDSPDLVEACEAIRRIVRDGKRAGDVISRMRALFKKTPVSNEQVDMNEVIREVLTLTQPEVQKNRVSLSTQFANDLSLVMGDKIQLQQVILNLVVNAIEAMSEVAEGPRDLWISSQNVTELYYKTGKEEGAIKVSAKPESALVLVAVRDSGPGLDSTKLKQVFETFYTTKSQGMGMGLAISRSIIEAHHGRLWVTANMPQGALFQFTLPSSPGDGKHPRG